MNTVNKEHLLKCANIILRNIQSNGFERYDENDIRGKNQKLLQNTMPMTILRKVLGVFDYMFPILIRKLTRTKKKVFPTSYTHVINSLFIFEKNNIDIHFKYSSKDLLNYWIKNYVIEDGNNVYWLYPYQTFSRSFKTFDSDKKETLCIHFLARFGILLSKYNSTKYFIDLNKKTFLTTLTQHTFTQYASGLSISYHYNTKDATININTEFLDWLTSSFQTLCDCGDITKVNTIRDEITKFIINEQNEDGSWYYFGDEFMRKNALQPSIDCHHTGTVLHNIINIINSQNINDINSEALIIACNNGMKYYLSNYFTFKETANGYAALKKNNCRYGPVQYAEAIYSFCEYIKSPWADSKIKLEIKHKLPICVEQMLDLINKNDGSVPSEFRGPLKLNIDSIRWGNGPVLEAIARYLEVIDIAEVTYD